MIWGMTEWDISKLPKPPVGVVSWTCGIDGCKHQWESPGWQHGVETEDGLLSEADHVNLWIARSMDVLKEHVESVHPGVDFEEDMRINVAQGKVAMNRLGRRA
jgi:hypothetical protein